MIFDLGNGPFTLDGDGESITGLQLFYTHNLTLAKQSDETAQAKTFRFNSQTHLSLRREGIVGTQEQAADADVPAHCVEFADRATRRKT
jgi:hypothetical protein